jgi:c-di-GMP-binding flagellar brake protein YcgR
VTERRRFLRFDTALSALCELVSDKRKAHSKIKNISKEGALIVIDKKLSEGSELNLAMDVPGDNIPIFASCQVAWQKETNLDNTYETGVKFTNIGNADKGRLLEYIYTQWLRLLDNI